MCDGVCVCVMVYVCVCVCVCVCVYLLYTFPRTPFVIRLSVFLKWVLLYG